MPEREVSEWCVSVWACVYECDCSMPNKSSTTTIAYLLVYGGAACEGDRVLATLLGEHHLVLPALGVSEQCRVSTTRTPECMRS